MMDKKINILTRTSNRPKAFSICQDSIKNQTYKNIHHIVSYDNYNDYDSYISNYDNITKIKVDRELLINNDKSSNPNTGPYSPHNLYCNELLNSVEDGYIMFLDDDTMLINDSVIEEIVPHLSEDNIVIWKIKFPINHNNLIVPRDNEKFTGPTLFDIDTACFMVHIKHAKKFKWDSWKCADFRYIKKLCNEINNVKWLNKVMVQLNGVGYGNRKDI